MFRCQSLSILLSHIPIVYPIYLNTNTYVMPELAETTLTLCFVLDFLQLDFQNMIMLPQVITTKCLWYPPAPLEMIFVYCITVFLNPFSSTQDVTFYWQLSVSRKAENNAPGLKFLVEPRLLIYFCFLVYFLLLFSLTSFEYFGYVLLITVQILDSIC